MERIERMQLEAIRRHLHHELLQIERLLKTAQPARRLSDQDVRNRVVAICQTIKSRGGSVTRDQLREICQEHKLRFTTVGALFRNGFLWMVGGKASLTKRGLTAK
ncbi:MAG: hypothetical protein HZB39_12195 [Planctomycetes bacterium]|nr:hypothetical protein [Planctomycetota bacterium]